MLEMNCCRRMKREQWGHHSEYVLTLLGFTVGVGTVWKFPYMVARNGGGSFLIPYLLFVMVAAIPLTYLEMFIGQYSQNGPVGVWDMCPAVKGLGVGSALLSGIFAIYYPTFFSWILYYLFYSFYPTLPWTQCGQDWNSQHCVGLYQNTSITSNVTSANRTLYNTVTATLETVHIDWNGSKEDVAASEEFFRRRVLDITDGLEDMGGLRWPLVLCLFITFLTCYLCLIKGIRLSGKIVYVTVICPYILVTVFLVRACMLPGSKEGILFYITPDFERLQDPKVWMEACGFALYAMGVTYGFLISSASHNPMSNNCLRDAIMINIVSMLSQLYFGFSVFSITGHLAYRRGLDFQHYRTSGFKLGFITYPEATAFLPLPQLWSVLFFLMLFTLGIDSLMPCYDVISSVVGHWFPRLLKRRWLLNAVVIVPSFILAVPYTLQGGVYLLTLVEWFAFFPAILLFAIVQCIVVGWVYGTRRINKAMLSMQGAGISRFAEILWRYICPLFLLGFVGYSFYSYRPPQFEDYVYPAWANVIGWLISTSVVLPLPVYFCWSVLRAPGSSLMEKLQAACKARGRWDLDSVSVKKPQPAAEPFL